MLARFEVLRDDCIGCSLCEERAPDNLEMVPKEAAVRVVAQPANEDEERACMEAADYCPMGALSVVTPESSDEHPPAATVAAAAAS
ncbi:MAG: ferredoxin [Myxococcota bacterium]|jgi:ferredoxin|nr:hypothetical protein [Deltaproteobacteria bacterium]MCP4241584.1 ferredoxin [bacterium]MDP7075088.1 ferredoxin [Myxococcota bacterium]MDP7299851.1 ferredoxin [Myxococcota bacterium]MDP7432532.1 ferredoxin [Myxococcota bacterium]|tara:strand:+ start:315 stop:572 length:258 start_codon:yes stop_codon:yes gene_type:complete